MQNIYEWYNIEPMYDPVTKTDLCLSSPTLGYRDRQENVECSHNYSGISTSSSHILKS